MRKFSIDLYDMNHPLNVNVAYKKGGQPVEQTPLISPTAPVQEASVEIGADEFDDDAKNKSKGGKGELKIPLTPTKDTGLKL